MLNKVHHVTYAVNSIAEITDYMESKFDLKPIRTDEFTERGFKAVLFQVGETLVDFFEPDPRRHRPGPPASRDRPRRDARGLGRGRHRRRVQRFGVQGRRTAGRRPGSQPLRLQDGQHRTRQLPQHPTSSWPRESIARAPPA